MVFKGRLRHICLIFFIISVYEFFAYKLPNIVISKNAKITAAKDLKDDKLYLISGFRERYIKKIWEQELGLKKLDKNHLKRICMDGLCNIPEYGLLIIFKEKHLATICQDEIKIVINLTEEKNRVCKGSFVSINKQDLENNGTHMIWIDRNNIRIRSNKDYRFQKPWEN